MVKRAEQAGGETDPLYDEAVTIVTQITPCFDFAGAETTAYWLQSRSAPDRRNGTRWPCFRHAEQW